MTAKEINKKIQEMISSDSVPQDEIIRFVKGECQTVPLTPQTLGMLFEMYADVKYDALDPTSCFSREIPISELKNCIRDSKAVMDVNGQGLMAAILEKNIKFKDLKKAEKCFLFVWMDRM
mgnify:CR=1 FL=1